MRTGVLRSSRPARGARAALVWIASAAWACAGATGESGGSRPPEATLASAAPRAAAQPTPAASAPVEPPTTTTAGLGEPTEGRGTKLPEASPASLAATGGDAGATPHTHDPGRGLDDIRALVAAHRDEARACYDRALPDHPGLEGTLVVTWTIDPQGKVTRASIDPSRSEIADAAVGDCVAAVIEKIQFASSPGGYETHASYPFTFRPHRGRRLR